MCIIIIGLVKQGHEENPNPQQRYLHFFVRSPFRFVHIPTSNLSSNSSRNEPTSHLKFSGCKMPARLPSFTRFNVSAAINAAPTPEPSSAGKISIGSSSFLLFFSGQSRISRRARAPRCLKWGYLLKTDPSAPTWQVL